jgi:hypothetical protein
MKNQNTKELYESPNREMNLDKYGHITNQCICCGKPMLKSEKLYVHMNTNWVAVNPTIDESKFKELTGAESQGCFPIGNSCAKKMLGFTFLSK